MILDESVKNHLIEEYGKRGLKMSDSQFRQAERPSSGTPIPNPNGTAPGLHTAKDNHHVFALPGPKNEFGPMLTGPIKAILDQIHTGKPLHSRTLRVVGISEAIIGEKLSTLMEAENPTVAPYAKTGEVHLRITTSAATTKEADEIINPIADQIRSILGSAIYAEGEESLAAWIIQELTRRGHTIATAESCTGGLLAAELTSIDGSSKVFPAGFVTYSAESKNRELGVDLETLRTSVPSPNQPPLKWQSEPGSEPKPTSRSASPASQEPPPSSNPLHPKRAALFSSELLRPKAIPSTDSTSEEPRNHPYSRRHRRPHSPPRHPHRYIRTFVCPQ
ncbi:hypothetical protein CCB80_15620 [Armatimonadetes bacterium Uphvl-Ar1]|nr:hypothetical protein CCB80_15620 [Armatimonadetes bacterium Uphvl-Ar1]